MHFDLAQKVPRSLLWFGACSFSRRELSACSCFSPYFRSACTPWLRASGRSSRWVPQCGGSTTINPGVIRGDGVPLQTAISVAYGIPAVRVIGPGWLAGTSYAIHAEVAPDAKDSFRMLFQRELKNRLRLGAHTEERRFDVFVLAASRIPELERAAGEDSRTYVHERDMRAQDVTLSRLAGALQNVLGKPVIDETGIAGFYNFEFRWGENRIASVTAVLRDRFGLVLTPGSRNLEALVVDSIQPDAALSLLSSVARLTRGAPPLIRQRISSTLSIH